MSGFNLPPGCTDADIDRAMGGDAPLCAICRDEFGREDDIEEAYHKGRFQPVHSKCAAEVEDR